jgi:hypothetical protein
MQRKEREREEEIHTCVCWQVKSTVREATCHRTERERGLINAAIPFAHSVLPVDVEEEVEGEKASIYTAWLVSH